MGKNFRSYTFIPTINNPYIADNGGLYSVASRIGYNAIIDAAVSEQIVVAAGANLQPDNQPPNTCDNQAKNGWFDPRFLQFEYQTGVAPDITNNKLKVVLPDIAAILTVAAEIKNVLTTAGGRVRCIKLLGEKFTNIIYEAGPNPLPAFAPSPRFSLPKLFTGIYRYESDVIDAEDTYLPFAFATDVAGASPSTVDITLGITPLPNTRCKLKYSSIKEPRHVVVTTRHPEGMQKTIVPIAEDGAEDIAAAQVAFASLASAVCVRYQGETNNRVAKYLP